MMVLFCGVQVSVLGLRDLEDCFWILNGLLTQILPATCMQEVHRSCFS